MIKNIIFDFDGVIENTYDFCYDIEKERNYDLNHEKFKLIFCGNYWNCVDEKYHSEKSIDDYENRYREEISDRVVDVDIKNMIEKLAKRYRLFIVSSCSERSIELYLRNNNLDSVFEEIMGRETHFSKIEKFKMLFQKYNTFSKNCIFITDTLGDIKEANNVGVKTVAVTWGYHDWKLLKQGNPELIIDSYDDVILKCLNI